jgi:hypothetical protein
MKTTEPALALTLPQSIPFSRLSDLLCCGFEGGIGYWATITGYVKPSEMTFRRDPDHLYKHLDYPLNPGGAVNLEEDTGDEDPAHWTLDMAAIKRGCEVMARDYPKHWADFLGENDDANTGDVFIQCCVLGEVVYG